MSQKVKAKNDQPQPQARLILGGIIAAALVVAIGFIVLSASGGGATRAAINYDELVVTPTDNGGYILGNPDAPFTLVIFEDFLCSHCHDYEPIVEAYLKEFVVTGKGRFEFRMLQSASPTPLMFQLAQCTEQLQPGSFYKARAELFFLGRSGFRADSGPRQFAETMGINYSELLACQKDAKQYISDAQLAKTLGATGTPAVYVRRGDSPITREPSLGERPSIEDLRRYITTQYPETAN